MMKGFIGMNILALNNLRFNAINNKALSQNNKVSVPTWGLKMNPQLSEDTVSFNTDNNQSVSFGATAKFLTTHSGGISKATAIEINEMAEEVQPGIMGVMKSIFSDFVVSEEKPNNLIMFISGRAKKPDSIVEKDKILQEKTKAGVLSKMTDLNGVKIVLNDGARKNVHKTLNILLNAIKKGIILVDEVEPKRPKEADKLKGKERAKFDYADPDFLQKFIKEAENTMGKSINFEDPNLVSGTKANYTALHLLLRLPGQKRPFELQIMGPSVAKYKHLDDILFKILNNKNVDKKYQPIVDLLKPLVMTEDDKIMKKYFKIREKMDKLKFSQQEYELLTGRITAGGNLIDEATDTSDFKTKVNSLLRAKDIDKNDLEILSEHVELEGDYLDKDFVKKFKSKVVQHDMFADYRAKAFLFQRIRKPVKYNSNDSREYFLPMTVDLPGEYDLNKLYRVLLDCEKNTEEKSDNTSKTAKIKVAKNSDKTKKS